MKKCLTVLVFPAFLFFGGCTNTNDEDVFRAMIFIEVNDFSATIDENPATGQVIGRLDVTTNAGSLIYSILAQSPSGAIDISLGGEVLVKEPGAFDFETNQEVTAQVEVSGGGVAEVITATITIRDLSEGAGLVVNDFTTDFEENPENGEVIGTLSASSSNGELLFNLVSQMPDGALSVESTSGEIAVADASLFVFADYAVIRADVEVSDGKETENLSVSINLLEAPTIWTGSKIIFTKADGADPNQAPNQDRITDNVWITRGNDGGQIYNAKVETWSESIKSTAPYDTEWAQGTTSNIESLTFLPFRDAVSPKSVVGKDLVLHLITDDVYLDVRFIQWSSGRAGGFAYERSTESN